jgi:hypothetical protein
MLDEDGYVFGRFSYDVVGVGDLLIGFWVVGLHGWIFFVRVNFFN